MSIYSYALSIFAMGRDSGGRGPPLSRGPPGGAVQPRCSPRPDGRSACFGIRRPASKLSVRRIPKQPGAYALGCNWLRRERDSNSRYPFGVHTLSRRASSATRASLQYVSGAFRSKPDCKGSKKIRKSHKTVKILWDFPKVAYCLSMEMLERIRPEREVPSWLLLSHISKRKVMEG